MADHYKDRPTNGQGRYQAPPQEAPKLPQQLPPLLTKDGALNPDLFKEDLLKQVAASIQNVSKNQMRRVFDNVKRHKFALESGKNWEEIYPYMLMQKAQISYLCKRKSEENKFDQDYYQNLKTLIFKLVDMCDSAKAYIAYADFLEALYGYYYEIAKRK